MIRALTEGAYSPVVPGQAFSIFQKKRIDLTCNTFSRDERNFPVNRKKFLSSL
ncbi:MAG: hypothetical protein D3906_04000 [Candidatus Electrothrix sp. AUS1_2]|nr:hypothetical protein [Candidatus Electrothrix sp. AUS1_2]